MPLSVCSGVHFARLLVCLSVHLWRPLWGVALAPKQTYPIRNYAVGQYLLTLRSRARLTQSELAERIGVHRRSVQKWESSETYPTVENLRTLIAVLLPLGGF